MDRLQNLAGSEEDGLVEKSFAVYTSDAIHWKIRFDRALVQLSVQVTAHIAGSVWMIA